MGLHVDTNNGKPFRYATAIMYLNDVGEGGGGETIFPVDDAARKEDPPCHEEALFGDGITHTGERETDATKKLLELGHAATRGNRGLAVAPRRGLMVLFYSRTRRGELDANAWHGGCVVHPDSPGKWTAQKFFEVPPKYRRGADLQGWDPTHGPLRMFCHRHVPDPLGVGDVDDDPVWSDDEPDVVDVDRGGAGSDDDMAAYRAAAPRDVDCSLNAPYDADAEPDDRAPPGYGEHW